MEVLSLQEQQWLRQMRLRRDRLYIGIDHHSAQLTIAAATGEEIFTHAAKGPEFSWMKSGVFSQDGPGYLELLADLAERYPEIPRTGYLFLSEPSYAKPFSHFIRQSGFAPEQVLWVDARKVSQFRKSHHLGAAGKNDVEDARAIAALLFQVTSETAEPIRLFQMAPLDLTAETLAGLAEEYRRLTGQSIQLQNKIFQKVLLLFPEVRQIWSRSEKHQRPDGGNYTRQRLVLFESQTPLRLLYHFPTPRQLHEAGFDGVWQAIGSGKIAKEPIRRLLKLAEQSAGIPNPLWARQLQLLIEEYRQIQERLEAYQAEMEGVCRADPVLASLRQIPNLSIQALAAIAGALGDVSRFRNADQVKRYLNLAPQPLAQTGKVDEQGRPVQAWRFPANTYRTVNGQRRLQYQSPGRKDIRVVAYFWFRCLIQNQRRHPDDPFSRLYNALKAKHQGKNHWLGRVRWKVVAKLVETIYYCLKYRRPYDPAKVAINV